jgi:hypothetical protein
MLCDIETKKPHYLTTYGVLEALMHSYLLTAENGGMIQIGDFLFINTSI